MKKVIIIEGVDNVGKSSLISKLNEYYNGSVEILHSEVPPKDCSLFNFYYDGLIHNTLDAYYNKDVGAIIHDRSMYGEYVYGPKYRNEDKNYISKLISDLESGQLNTFILSNELYFILLTSSDISLITNNDDGKSISNKSADIEEETKLFNEVFDLSKIKNKKRIYVNSGSEFRNKDDIYSEVLNFINQV